MEKTTRRAYLAAAGGTLATLAGCLGGADSGGDGDTSGEDGDTPDGDGTVPTDGQQLPLPMSPADLRDEARSGGPPKDGIPSIDDPSFIDPGAAEFMDPGDPVFGVARDGAVKAYPQKILVSHEIVNDTLGGTPVSVTYCPLTGTAQGFDRGSTTFGVSGRLINNNLVMYDRGTETWWPQMLATAIPGPWNEDPEIRSLREFRLVWTTWQRWQDQHPDTRVLSTETGHAKNYANDPYGSYNPRGGYYTSDSTLFPSLSDDDRYDPKTVVMGARTPDGAAAFPKAALREQGLLTGEIGSTPALAVYDPGLDTGYAYLNPDGHSFDHDGETVVGPDGTAHAPEDLPLSRVHLFDAMWFAWSGYYPETNVHA